MENKWRVYYRLIGGVDASITYWSMLTMQLDVTSYAKLEFDYINACMVCEDGSEEIVATGIKEILELK